MKKIFVGIIAIFVICLVGSSNIKAESESAVGIGSSPIYYQTHIENIGWTNWAENGEISGTEGKSLRLEGLKISLSGPPSQGTITYQAHVQNIGWMDAVEAGELAGTEGQSLRLEAIKINLSGDILNTYDIYYRVHIENIGWTNWTGNDTVAGSIGLGYRLEAIQIKLVEKGNRVKSDYYGTANYELRSLLNSEAHIENIGWISNSDNTIIGTTGRSLRLEALKLSLKSNGSPSGITYQTHVQNVGWTDWVADGEMSGTEGQNLRLEAVKIKLTGFMSYINDIYYRTHVENIGWTNWVKNGEMSGTTGQSLRIEAIEVGIVSKNAGSRPGERNPLY